MIVVDLSRLAFAKKGDIAHGGLLKNISASGLAIKFIYPLGKVENPFEKGDVVEVEIDEIGSLKGTVVRTSDNSIAIKLDIDSKGEDELIARIMEASSLLVMDAVA
ncbi:MAG: PilZ domain-containing protein [Proteobacteria bacterium]|nr:PilZ domain-containing protein [Pseudomonadota bacterium]